MAHLMKYRLRRAIGGTQALNVAKDIMQRKCTSKSIYKHRISYDGDITKFRTRMLSMAVYQFMMGYICVCVYIYIYACELFSKFPLFGARITGGGLGGAAGCDAQPANPELFQSDSAAATLSTSLLSV
jgi:hypothetical protein